MAKRIVTKIGNVFCAEIDSEKKAYFQYVANDMSMLNRFGKGRELGVGDIVSRWLIIDYVRPSMMDEKMKNF